MSKHKDVASPWPGSEGQWHLHKGLLHLLCLENSLGSSLAVPRLSLKDAETGRGEKAPSPGALPSILPRKLVVDTSGRDVDQTTRRLVKARHFTANSFVLQRMATVSQAPGDAGGRSF